MADIVLTPAGIGFGRLRMTQNHPGVHVCVRPSTTNTERFCCRHSRPGDVVEMEMEGVDAWVVRRVQPATFSGPLRLVESAGELRAAGGPVLTNDEVRRLIGDDP
ncbi:MAG: hypothetical protein ACKOET_08980 [Verrucomicrobiota bacterium]